MKLPLPRFEPQVYLHCHADGHTLCLGWQPRIYSTLVFGCPHCSGRAVYEGWIAPPGNEASMTYAEFLAWHIQCEEVIDRIHRGRLPLGRYCERTNRWLEWSETFTSEGIQRILIVYMVDQAYNCDVVGFEAGVLECMRLAATDLAERGWPKVPLTTHSVSHIPPGDIPEAFRNSLPDLQQP